MKSTSSLAFAFLGFALFVPPFVAAGCGSDESGVPGGTVLDGGGGSSATGGTSGRSDATTRPPSSSPFGTACLEDSDCTASGTFCLTQTSDQFLGGGPQGGLCTAECMSDSDCEAIGSDAFCLIVDDADTPLNELDDTSLCFQACTPGQATSPDEKCHGRGDMVCFAPAMTTGIGVCQPACTSDFECGDGRVCDLGLGICVDPADREGALQIGAECDPNDDQCEGFCVQFQGGINMCSGLCNFSLSGFGCGNDPRTTDPLDAMCLFTSASAGLGDDGICGQLCDCDGDCRHPDFICQAFPEQSGLAGPTGRAGFCSVPDSDGGAVGIPCEGEEDSGAPTPDAGGQSSEDSGAPDAGASDGG